MPISTLSSKGQMTIPKEVRDALKLKPLDKVVILVEGERAILHPLRGNILEIGGSIKIPKRERPIDFHKVREVTRKTTARRIVEEMKK